MAVLGSISNATPITVTLNPVVAATAIVCPVTTSLGSGSLTATATCADVPGDVYGVSISIGGDYYTGAADSVVAVYDPSLGSLTGGGTVLHNGVPANFGINVKYVKYLKNGQIRGGMLYTEHRLG